MTAAEDPPKQAESGSVGVKGGGSVTAESGTVEAVLAKADPPPAPKDKLEEDLRKARRERMVIDVRLAKFIGYGALIAVAAQIVLADVAFFIYGFENDWHIPAAAISAWLVAIVVQVIGILLVVAKDIFPGTGGGTSDP